MKKIDDSNVIENVRRMGGVSRTLKHIEEAYSEAIGDFLKGLSAQFAGVMSLYGLVNSGSGSNYVISAGAVFYNGEYYAVDAFTGTAPGGTVPVLNAVTTWRSGDPIKYSDGNTFNTHKIVKLQFSFATSGSGLADFADIQTMKKRINADLLDVPGQIAALVNSAPSTLDTLKELADALGDDANFATTVATQLGLKSAKALPAWTNLSLINSWTNVGLNAPGYRITDQNVLQIFGIVKNPNASPNQVIANLPNGTIASAYEADRAVVNFTDNTFARLVVNGGSPTTIGIVAPVQNKFYTLDVMIPLDGTY